MATTGTTPCPTFYLYSCAAVRIPSCSPTPIPLATLPASTASSSPPCGSNATLHETTREPPTEVTWKSRLPSAECLAIHLFMPCDNENKAAKKKWGKRCPVCKRHDAFKDQLASVL